MVAFHGKKRTWSMPSTRKSDNAIPAKRGRGNVYGRRMTRPLGAVRQAAFDALYPALGIAPELTATAATIDPASLYPGQHSQHWLEIGFGNGEHLSGLMAAHPERGFIGAEPFINGMAAFLKDIQDKPHANVRVFMDDAMLLVRALRPETIDGIYLLNPDPWPKARHHKRRMAIPANLAEFTRILKPGGQLIMATDVDELAGWMLTQAFGQPGLRWSAESAADWRTMPQGWIETRYQRKGAAAGRRQTYLMFEKVPS